MQFVVENGHKKDRCCDESGLCAQQYLDTILGSTVNTIGRVKEKDDLHFHCISTSILKLDMTSYMDLNCSPDATTGDLIPMAKIIFGVGIAHNRASTLYCHPILR